MRCYCFEMRSNLRFCKGLRQPESRAQKSSRFQAAFKDWTKFPTTSNFPLRLFGNNTPARTQCPFDVGKTRAAVVRHHAVFAIVHISHVVLQQQIKRARSTLRNAALHQAADVRLNLFFWPVRSAQCLHHQRKIHFGYDRVEKIITLLHVKKKPIPCERKTLLPVLFRLIIAMQQARSNRRANFHTRQSC